MILTKDQVKKVSGVKVGKKVRKTIDDAHMYPEGKWLFKVNSPKDAADIKKNSWPGETRQVNLL